MRCHPLFIEIARTHIQVSHCRTDASYIEFVGALLNQITINGGHHGTEVIVT